MTLLARLTALEQRAGPNQPAATAITDAQREKLVRRLLQIYETEGPAVLLGHMTRVLGPEQGARQMARIEELVTYLRTRVEQTP